MQQDVKQSGTNIFQALPGSQQIFRKTFPMTEALSNSRNVGTSFTKNFKSLVADSKIDKDISIFPTCGPAQSVSWPNEPQHDVKRDDFNAHLPKSVI